MSRARTFGVGSATCDHAAELGFHYSSVRIIWQCRSASDGTGTEQRGSAAASSTPWTTSSVNELHERRFERDVEQRTAPELPGGQDEQSLVSGHDARLKSGSVRRNDCVAQFRMTVGQVTLHTLAGAVPSLDKRSGLLEVTGSSVPSGLAAGIANRACSPRMAVRPLRGFPGFTVLITVAPVLGRGVKLTLVLGHIGLLVAAARLLGSATCSTWIIAHAACLPLGRRFIRLGHATITEATQYSFHRRSGT
jgi:hypothetical protein